MVNEHKILGRVGKDPEIKHLDNGEAIATFSVATSKRWKDKATGDQKEQTQWHRIVCFNSNISTKIIEPHVKKGALVWISGEIQTRSYEDRDSGQTRYVTETVIGRYEGTLILADRPSEKPTPSEDSYGTTKTRPAASGGYASREDPAPAPAPGQPRRPAYDDEIPF